jgi:hypothetical protein
MAFPAWFILKSSKCNIFLTITIFLEKA